MTHMYQAALTPRERDVVQGVLGGQTNHEIARQLGLTEQSVKNVLSVVYEKLQLRNRLELALYGVRHESSLQSPASIINNG